jgi:DNA polymerase-3 subunit delta
VLYIWHGDDDFSIKERLDGLREAVAPESVRDANVTELTGAEVSPKHLAMVCRSAPFLAQRRLVVVRGLLGRAEGRPGARRRSTLRDSSGSDEWALFQEALTGLPETTDVVLLDGRLGRDNPFLRRLGRLGQVEEFPALRGERLRHWVQERTARKGGRIQPDALVLLCEMVGGNLWAMEGELEKLALRCEGRPAQKEDVAALVAVAREASVFAALDAIFEGRPDVAQRLVQGLLASGWSVQHILALMARQLRHLVLTRDLLARGAPRAEVARQLGITSEFVVRKVVEQARSFSREQLSDLYVRLLETDVAIKSGQVDEDLGLEMLVARAADPSQRVRRAR